MTQKKSLVFVIPGKPVPYVRTTQRSKYISKQFSRYQDWKKIARISYSLEISKSKYKFMGKQKETSTITQKQYWTAYRESLMRMIGTAKDQQQNFVKVSI